MEKLSNKDKEQVRQALEHCIPIILQGISDKSGYYHELEGKDIEAVQAYCYKIIRG